MPDRKPITIADLLDYLSQFDPSALVYESAADVPAGADGSYIVMSYISFTKED